MTAPGQSTTSMPQHGRSLFDGYASLALAADEAADFVIGRLLEAGDRGDLRWLVARHGEGVLVDWLQCHGHRRLSDRSRRFWSQLLDVEVDKQHGERRGEALWPL